ncbi:cytochrome P450 [Boletus reticuloceps]|uniref:Cytochrome P450 n=1 Tax=Boletus reticuloceps TaxID=495285 RepID=A0A8I3A6Y0_9AGAM|nr:cytochrome P450 [Boletus reticuloceps]
MIALGCMICYRRSSRSRHGLPLPPGPKPLPLIGNILDIDSEQPWLTYGAWRKKYGPIVYCQLLGQDVVIINSSKVARQLLDQRSSTYSGRPTTCTSKLFGIDFATAFLPYGPQWRIHRRMFRQAMKLETVELYQNLYRSKAMKLIQSLLDSPDDFDSHIQLYIISITMAFTYGYETDSLDAPLVKSLAEFVKLLNDGLPPERNAMLTAFPFLANIPSWFPGATFKRDALRSRELSLRCLDGPFEYVRKSVESGSFTKSMVSDLLDRLDGTGERASQEKAIKECAATVYIAGYDSSAATLLAFLMAMMLYPEAQRRAQAEIDSVLADDVLPDFSHRKSLPYVEAVLRETMRWHSVAPLALPHMTCCDDVFEGYFIPKGAPHDLIGDAWEIHHEESEYPEPYVFNPDRHLSEDGTVIDGDPLTSRVAFGFGRRHCPGKWVADSILWMGIVSILAVFRIDKGKDGTGREIEVEPKFTAGVIRSASKEDVVRSFEEGV